MGIITPSNIVVVASDRHEVSNAVLWDDSSGSDFFFEPDVAQISGTGNAEDLSDVGWVTTSLAFVQGSGADFFTADANTIPSHYLTDAAVDLLQSPAIFGDNAHALQAEHHLGKSPTTLTLEGWLAFSVNSADEAATGFGFVVNGGSPITEAGHVAFIVTDGTNFVLRSAADSDAGATDDALWHLFKIVVSTGSVTDAVEWFIDGTSQGTMDRTTDVWPVSVGWSVEAAATNRILIGPARVFYR